jgi:hypothetical protein
MQKIFIGILFLFASVTVYADNFNSVSVQGQLNPPTPIYGVTVDILSGGQVVGTASSVDLSCPV